MSYFTIKRIESAFTIGLEPECAVGKTRCLVTMLDTTTGELQYQRACLPLSEAAPSDVFAALTAAGFQPNDWS